MEVEYRPRLVDPLIAELVGGVPAVSIIGPRASGKTTTARRYARTVVRLDQPDDANFFRLDPDAALRARPEPVLLDEWQEVPTVLAAVKRSVDEDPRPGRYILTGSVRAELGSQTWPGTGRVIHVPMMGLTVRELLGDPSADAFIDRVAQSGSAALLVPDDPPDIRNYLDLISAGGFPEPTLRIPFNLREQWFDSYVQELFTRDVPNLEPRRDPQRLRLFFEAFALNTAGIVDNKTLFEAAGIDRKTAEAYEHLLKNMFIIDALPAWFTNRLKRLVRTPKRYVVDSALAAAVIGIDTEGLTHDRDLLGRLLDTFVVSQLRAELPVSASRPRLYHLRQEGGRREVDVLIELSGHRVIAIEIKASASPGLDSGRHLAWLRDELGDRFIHGLVLHTGRHIYPLGDRVTAAPICTIWS